MMELIVITGMSGAGKSHALKKLEDMGYYCVDNFPLALISAFADMALEKSVSRAAMCIDCRDGTAPVGLFEAMEALGQKGIKASLLFLDASDEVLIKRYSETRRAHPLAHEGLTSKGIEKERALLSSFLDKADYYIDTSSMKPAQLGSAIESLTGAGHERTVVIVESFGFKRGIPPESDMVFDVRFVPNPFWIDTLRPLSGLDKPVRDYVMSFPEADSFATDIASLITRLIPSYEREGKHRLNISIGCTGGRHRSVCMSDAITTKLIDGGINAVLSHRDIDK